MSNDSVFESIARHGVVPVVAIESADDALPLADTLLEAGLPVVEITFRTAAATEVIRAISRERPEMLVGAGTVLTTENLEAAERCGARFGVAPGLNPEIVARAGEIGLPFVPGVATPSDIECGLSMGCDVLKFFPSEALGGVAMLKALFGPYRHTGLRFVPTGGIGADNLQSYLAMDFVTAVGGTWIAKQKIVAEKNWAEIRRRCLAAKELVAPVRGAGGQ